MSLTIEYKRVLTSQSTKLFFAFLCVIFSLNIFFAQKINQAEYKNLIQKQDFNLNFKKFMNLLFLVNTINR
jgi:hypothetical protein